MKQKPIWLGLLPPITFLVISILTLIWYLHTLRSTDEWTASFWPLPFLILMIAFYPLSLLWNTMFAWKSRRDYLKSIQSFPSVKRLYDYYAGLSLVSCLGFGLFFVYHDFFWVSFVFSLIVPSSIWLWLNVTVKRQEKEN